MVSTTTAKRAAVGATVGFAGLALFQMLLAAGAPFGEAAWGGEAEGRLSTPLRVGSGLSVVVYGAAAALLLRRAGFRVRWVPHAVARVGSWVLVVLLTMGTVANLASQSPWERMLLGPVSLVLAALSLVVASSEGATGPVSGGAGGREPSHRPDPGGAS